MKKLSVVIPMYNERENAPRTASMLSSYLTERLSSDFEIVFCDDGSHDGCADLVKELGIENVRVIGYADNRGKGSAVREGVLACDGEYVVYTDSDLAYGCDAVYGIFNELCTSKKDAVIGSRNVRADGYEGYTLMRRLMSKTYIKVIAFFAGFKYSDSQCGIKAFKTERAKDIFSRCQINGFAFDLEVLILADKLGMRISEYPVKVINHDQSGSKVNPVKDAVKMLRDVRRIKKLHRYVKQ